MNARHSLICLFFLTLRDGNSGLTNAQNLDRTETEGGNITVSCSFILRGGKKLFCKGKCKEGNILVETTGDSAQRGRYSIRYVEGSFPTRDTILYVSITKLTKSDAGRYQCGLEERSFLVPYSHQDFEIRVTEEVTPRPFPLPAPSASPLTTTQSLSSVPSSASPERTTQSLSSVPSSASPERTMQPQQGQTALDGVVLYAGLILLVMFIVLSVALLIFCWKRARKEPPVETGYVSDTETNRLEIREMDKGRSSPPAETSTIYSYVKPNQPNRVQSTDEYSLVTAATAQKEAKDDLDNLNYSEVDFSKSRAAPLHSAPCGYTDNVLYSVPRVAQSSDVSQAEDASPPLYSTVSLHPL